MTVILSPKALGFPPADVKDVDADHPSQTLISHTPSQSPSAVTVTRFELN